MTAATEPEAPAAQEESRMRKKTTTKNAARNRARGATTTTTATATTSAKEPRKNTKLEAIGKMLAKKDGCTTADVLAQTNWPSVSMNQQAKALGITLHKKKVDGVTRYSDHAIAS